MSAHIVGRPDDDLLDIMLGHGADPEQAFIRGSAQRREEGDGSEHTPRRSTSGTAIPARTGRRRS